MGWICLSSYEFRAYLAARDQVSLRLRCFLFVEGRDNGHISYFFYNPIASLKLASAKKIALDCANTVDREYRVPKPDVYMLMLSTLIHRRDYVEGPAVLHIEYASKVRPEDRCWSHRHVAIVKPLPHSAK